MYRILFTIIAILLILIIYKHKVVLLFSNSVNRCNQIHEPFDFKQDMNSHDHYFEKQISDKKDERRKIVNKVSQLSIADNDLTSSINTVQINIYLKKLNPDYTTLIEPTNIQTAITQINTEKETIKKKNKIKLLLIKILLEDLYNDDNKVNEIKQKVRQLSIADNDLDNNLNKTIIIKYLKQINPDYTTLIETANIQTDITQINTEKETIQKKNKIKLLLIKILLDDLYSSDSYYNKNLPCVYYDTDNCPTETCKQNITDVGKCLALSTKSECNAGSVDLDDRGLKSGCKYDDYKEQCKPEHLCIPKTTIIDTVKECHLYSKYGAEYCNQLKGVSGYSCKYNEDYKICNDSVTDITKFDKDKNINKCFDGSMENDCIAKPNINKCKYDSELGICGAQFDTDCSIYDSVYTNDNTEMYDNKKSLCVTTNNCNFIEYNIKPQVKYLQNKYFGKCVNDTDLKTLIGTDTNEKNPELIQVFNAENNIDIKTVIRINKAKNVCESLGDHYEWIKNSDLSHEGGHRCIPKCEILNKENCKGDPKNCYFNELDDVCKLKCGVTETRDGCIKNGDCYWEDSGNTGYCHSLTKENNTEICGKIRESGDCNNNLHCYYDTQCKAKDTDLEIMGGLLTDKEELKSIF